MKRVCVLMSTYNGEKYLEEQLDSILNQKGDFSLDILVRDDGSKDNTISILKKYSDENKLTWYTGENLKPAKSFIDLMLHVSNDYDYYAFSDQDDYWKSNKIEKSIENLVKDVPALCYSNPELVDGDLNPLGRKVYKNKPYLDLYSIICGANIIGCTVLFNKQLLDVIKYGGMPNVITMHDSYLARVCVSIGGKISYDSNSYMKYRQHGNNVIGINTGVSGKIKNRIHDIFNKANITIDEQTNEILRIYDEKIPIENKKWLVKVGMYRKNILNRVSLAFSLKTKYISKNMSLKIRLAILFGNR